MNRLSDIVGGSFHRESPFAMVDDDGDLVTFIIV